MLFHTDIFIPGNFSYWQATHLYHVYLQVTNSHPLRAIPQCLQHCCSTTLPFPARQNCGFSKLPCGPRADAAAATWGLLSSQGRPRQRCLHSSPAAAGPAGGSSPSPGHGHNSHIFRDPKPVLTDFTLWRWVPKLIIKDTGEGKKKKRHKISLRQELHVQIHFAEQRFGEMRVGIWEQTQYKWSILRRVTHTAMLALKSSLKTEVWIPMFFLEKASKTTINTKWWRNNNESVQKNHAI